MDQGTSSAGRLEETANAGSRLVSSFVGVALGLCAIAALVWGVGRGFLMRVPLVPDPAWVGDWARNLVSASSAQELALGGLMGVFMVALLLAASTAAVCGALLLAEERIAATRSVAIRAALGIGQWPLVVQLARGAGARGRRAGAIAFGVALACGFAIRWTWPDQVLDWSSLDLALAVGAGLAAMGIVVAIIVLPGLAIWRHKRLFAFLSRQSSAFPDRGESFGRDVAVVCQVAVAVSVLVLIGGFVGSSPERAGVDTFGEDTVAIPMEIAASLTEPERARFYESLLASFAERPDFEAESIATPGALIGLGANGIMVTDCGECIIGQLHVPLRTLQADHHAVGPGFFGLAGYEIVRGRDFTNADASDGARVAIVNRAMADEYFERGDAVGRAVQIGRPFSDWYEVVGVVDQPRAAAMGAQSSRRPALYLSALQVPPARSTLIVRPTSSTEIDPERIAELVPFGAVAGSTQTVASVRRTSWVWQADLLVGGCAPHYNRPAGRRDLLRSGFPLRLSGFHRLQTTKAEGTGAS
jgi:hypothetical protein